MPLCDVNYDMNQLWMNFQEIGFSPFHLLFLFGPWQPVSVATFPSQGKAGQRLVHHSGQAAEGALAAWIGWDGDGMGMGWGWNGDELWWIGKIWELFSHRALWWPNGVESLGIFQRQATRLGCQVNNKDKWMPKAEQVTERTWKDGGQSSQEIELLRNITTLWYIMIHYACMVMHALLLILFVIKNNFTLPRCLDVLASQASLSSKDVFDMFT